MRKLLVITLIVIITLSVGYLINNIITVRKGTLLVNRLNTIRWRNDKDIDPLIDEIKPRYYRTLYACLKSPDAHQRLMAAYVLIRKGKTEYMTYLEAGLKSESTREEALANRLIWSVWFNEAGIDSREILYSCKDLMGQGKIDEAIAKLTKLTLRKPNFAEAYNQRAIAFYMKNDYVRSIADCRTALELNPIHFGSQSGMGECYLKLGKYDEARDALETALKITPHASGTKALLEKANTVLQRRNKNVA